MALSYAQVYQLARLAGLGKQAAITATAIAAAESGRNPAAVGDQSLADGKWGPSIGLWQIRSLHAHKGTGRPRDANQLRDPAFNARAMVSISDRGSNWSPWSVYKSGAYRRHLAAAQEAAGGDRKLEAPKMPAGQVPVGDDFGSPLPGDDGIPGYADDLLGWGKDAAGGVAGDVAEAVGQRVMSVVATVLPYAAALALGVGLIGLGAWHTAKGAAS